MEPLKIDIGENAGLGPEEPGQPISTLDIWEESPQATAPISHTYSHTTENDQKTLAVWLTIMGVLCGGIGYVIYDKVTSGLQSVGEMMADNMDGVGSVGDLNDTLTDLNDTLDEANTALEEIDNEPVAPGEDPVFDRRVEGNPYWHLGNRVEGRVGMLERSWTPRQERVWRSGITHKYRWQRYKTVRQVVAERLKGSEQILWMALDDSGFWVRMRALSGLADFGIEFNLEAAERALGDASPDLIRRWFKRFRDQASPGELYTLRQVIRVVGAAARLEILRVLNLYDDEISTLYLYAANKDPSSRVQKWLSHHGRKFGIDDLQLMQTAFVSGEFGSSAQKSGFTSESAEVQDAPADTEEVEIYNINEDLYNEDLPSQSDSSFDLDSFSEEMTLGE